MKNSITHSVVFKDSVKPVLKNKSQTDIDPVFKKEDFCLYHNDSLLVMSKFPNNYVDMIFADPPYMLSNDGITCYKNLKKLNFNLFF